LPTLSLSLSNLSSVGQAALWTALKRGDLQVVSSDHSAYHFGGGTAASKTAGGPSISFNKIPMGLPGLECRMPLLVAGALEGKLVRPPAKCARSLSTQPQSRACLAARIE